MQVRRYYRVRNTKDKRNKNISSKHDRGYALKELKVRKRRTKVKEYSVDEPRPDFLESYNPEHTLINENDDISLQLMLLAKWITYSSGFIVPHDSFESFCLSLVDGVILTKLLYNFFEISQNNTYDILKNKIKNEFLANPCSEGECEANFNLFRESCRSIGLDSFNQPKRKELLSYSSNVLDKLLILEETLFTTNSYSGYSSDSEDTPLDSFEDSINLKGEVEQETKKKLIQQKRMFQFYSSAMKNRKRAIQERLAATSKSFGEVFPEFKGEKQIVETYLDAAGSLELPSNFWTLKLEENKEDVLIEEVEEDILENSEEIEEIEETEEDIEPVPVEKEKEKEKEISPVEDTRSEVFYVVSNKDNESESEDESEDSDDLVEVDEEEVMSLSTKMSLLLDETEEVEEESKKEEEEIVDEETKLSNDESTVKTSKSVVYYVIQELDEVDKGLTSMTDNILNRLQQLKITDRAVRTMDIFSKISKEEEEEQSSQLESEPTIRKELKLITNTLDDMSILKEEIKLE